MTHHLVSIIVPLYNAEKYIAETIKSALNQTWSNIEIIVINDGSTDNSLVVAKQFENEKVKIFSQDNKGASAARNYGLKIAKGEYIQFLDADDLISPNKIEEQVILLRQNEGKIAVCKTLHFFDLNDHLKDYIDNGEEWYFKEFDDPIDFLCNLYGVGPYGGMIQPNAWLTPISIINKAGIWNENLSLDDDGEFFCRIINASTGVVFSEKGLNYYRKFKKKSNLSSLQSDKAFKSALLSLNLKCSIVLSKKNEESVRRNFSRLYWEIAVACFPTHLKLSKTAEQQAIKLGIKKYNPLIGGRVKSCLQKIIGWKLVKQISHD